MLFSSGTFPSHRHRHGVSIRNYAQQHQCTEIPRRSRRKELFYLDSGDSLKGEGDKSTCEKEVCVEEGPDFDDNVRSFVQMKVLSEAIKTL